MDHSRRDLLKRSSLLGLGALLTGIPAGQAGAADAAATTDAGLPALRFRPDRTFTIVQFTDTHWLQTRDEDRAIRKQLHAEMEAILDLEKPDLVLLTGDIVTPRSKEDPPLPAWTEFVAPMVARRIPWAAVLGNHDDEVHKVPRSDLLAHLETLPFSCCRRGPPELDGSGDYLLDIAASTGDRPAARLYCMYSGAYSGDKTKTLGLWGWFSFERICWYRKQAREMTQRNGSPVPALAFFHIPLPEYKEAEKAAIGTIRDGLGTGDLNPGMFTAMVESRDVMGMFAGHAHLNDYAGYARGLCLGFGRKTGNVFAAYGKPPLPSGARTIVLTEGARVFDTWIRTPAGIKEHAIRYPEGFQELARLKAGNK